MSTYCLLFGHCVLPLPRCWHSERFLFTIFTQSVHVYNHVRFHCVTLSTFSFQVLPMHDHKEDILIFLYWSFHIFITCFFYSFFMRELCITAATFLYDLDFWHFKVTFTHKIDKLSQFLKRLLPFYMVE